MKTNETNHVVNAAKPRLSDEELDLLELDEVDHGHLDTTEEWLPWGDEDLIDIYKIIDKMSEQPKQIIEAFLEGKNFRDINVGEKYFFYWYNKAIAIIQKELKI